METLSLLFASATVLLAIIYIRRMKKQIDNVEKAFKDVCSLYHQEKEKNQIMLDTYWKEHKRIF